MAGKPATRETRIGGAEAAKGYGASEETRELVGRRMMQLMSDDALWGSTGKLTLYTQVDLLKLAHQCGWVTGKASHGKARKEAVSKTVSDIMKSIAK
jgi:hypothetical protein